MANLTVGDLNVAYDAVGAGEPVLMINGIGADRAAWYLQTPTIAREFRVITYDNRDVGETGAGHDPRSYPMRRFADDAVGLLDALGIERAHIVGASMGGAIAQEFALAYPARTRSATIVCSWARTDPWLAELLDLWEDVFATSGPVVWSRATWLVVFTYRYYQDPAHLAALLDLARANPRPQTAAMYRRQSRAAVGHDTLDRLAQIDVPVHVIAGEEDLLTPPRFSHEIAAAISGSRLSVMPNVGHGMFWEATDAFNELVLGFLRELRVE
jgi:pimeloyl-ACP methyl ester carboxylesterase